MSPARVTAVALSSPAARAGLREGDRLASINGIEPLDVIEYHQLVDDEDPILEVDRRGQRLELTVPKQAGEPLGLAVDSPVFDRIRTCDNHCEFCFIYQLPKGLRRSLYLKDDDYRLSFLYGNFTTLTRFTELDVERVVTERLSPLYVSIHAADPQLRATMLRNPRGATSLSWLEALLAEGIEVHGQVVLCPGVNDGEHLEATLEAVLDRYPRLASVGVVPLGVSRYSTEERMRPHTDDEARAVIEQVQRWQAVFSELLGRRMVFASDELYLQAGIEIPASATYEDFPQAENGIGLVRRFLEGFDGGAVEGEGSSTGFFRSVDGAPAHGYRSERTSGSPSTLAGGRTVVLSGAQFAPVMRSCLDQHGYSDVEVRVVRNDFFGGNTGVAGLMVGEDIARAVGAPEPDTTYVIPDTCLTEGRFLDGVELAELNLPVVAVPATGASLRAHLEQR